MSDKNNESLDDYLKELASSPRMPFKPGAIYNPVGDSIEVRWEDVGTYAHWLNDELTLIKSIETDEVVGVEIGPVSKITKVDEDV